MLEELPTVEHIKKRRPDLYNSWLCPLCNQQYETFNHIFDCRFARSKVISISRDSKFYLRSLIDMHTPHSRRRFISQVNLDINNIWDVSYDFNFITFIDLIKGFIPHSLTSLLNDFFKDNNITLVVISSFMDFIYVSIRDKIWLPRCERMIDLQY